METETKPNLNDSRMIKGNWRLLKFYLGYQRPYVRIAVIIAVLLLVFVLLQLPMPLITKYLIDTIIPDKDFSALKYLCLALLAILLIKQFCGFFMNYLTAKYKLKVRYHLERDLYLHMQDLPVEYFNRRSPGYILSRISEISSIESIMADTFLYIFKDAITVAVGAVLILSLHVQLGLFSLMILPFFVLSLKAFHRKLKEVNKDLKEENALYLSKLERNMKSIEKIKSSVKEKVEGERIGHKLFRVVNLGFKSEMVNVWATSTSSFIGLISPFVVLWYGISEIMKGNLTLGTFFAINSFLGYLFTPAKRLTEIGYSLSRAMAGLERIYEIFKEGGEELSGEEIESIESIQCQNIHFSYNEGKKVLNGLNLNVHKGEKIALLGESGEGKSTLVKMLLKFYAPNSGAILVSGKNIRDISPRSLRKKIAYISQSQNLLEEDIEEKINDKDVKDLLKKFRFLKEFNNYDSQVFQKELSGGEVQKLELVESILKDADLLIIDEGTSQIDFSVEKLVLNELYNKYKDKIIIFIAHRLTSITDFERILILKDGTICEEGTHAKLIENQGNYFSLWGNKLEHAQVAGSN